MKVCKKCNEDREFSDFDKYRKVCKICRKVYQERFKENNKDYHKEYCKKWREENPEYQLEKNKKWREENTEYNKIYYSENSSKIKENYKIWYCKNKEEIKIRTNLYRIDNIEFYRTYNRDYQKNRIKSDTLYRLSRSITSSIYNSIISKSFTKKSKTIEILGCSIEEFKLYLESRFEEWMTWENKGLYNGDFEYGWDIDHIIPTSSAETEEDIIRLNHYTNLQPLCSYTNRYIKRDNIL